MNEQQLRDEMSRAASGLNLNMSMPPATQARASRRLIRNAFAGVLSFALVVTGAVAVSGRLDTGRRNVGPAASSCDPTFSRIITFEIDRAGFSRVHATGEQSAYILMDTGLGVLRDGKISYIKPEPSAENAPVDMRFVKSDLAATPDGRAWVAAHTGGLWRIDGTKDPQFVTLPQAQNINEVETRGNAGWALGLTTDGKQGIWRLEENNRWVQAESIAAKNLIGAAQLSLNPDGSPVVVVMTGTPTAVTPEKPSMEDYKDSVWTHSSGQWREIDLPEGPEVVRITIGPDGTLWVVNHDLRVYRYRDGTWTTLPVVADQDAGILTDLVGDAQGRLWIVGAHQVGGVPGVFPQIAKPDAAPGENPPPPEPRLLVADDTVRSVKLPNEASNAYLMSISASPSGAIWFTNQSGVFRGSCS